MQHDTPLHLLADTQTWGVMKLNKANSWRPAWQVAPSKAGYGAATMKLTAGQLRAAGRKDAGSNATLLVRDCRRKERSARPGDVCSSYAGV